MFNPRDRFIELFKALLSFDIEPDNEDLQILLADTIEPHLENCSILTEASAEEGEIFIDNLQLHLIAAKEIAPDFEQNLTSGLSAEDILWLAKLANSISADVWDIEISENYGGFKVSPVITDEFYKNNMEIGYFHWKNSVNSLVYIDPSSHVFNQDDDNVFDRLTLIMCLLLFKKSNISSNKWLLSNTSNYNEKKSAYLKYHLALNQCHFSKIKSATGFVEDKIQQSLRANRNYKQYIKAIVSMGNVNTKLSLLDELISSYQILEDYTVRQIIAKIQTEGNGTFSLRSFKALYKASEKGEPETLKKLFNKCWGLTIEGESNLDYAWRLYQSFQEVGVDKETDTYRLLNKGCGPLDSKLKIKEHFSTILYALRCSIVHNKATEFHLTDLEFNQVPHLHQLLEKFVVPVCHRLAYGLPTISSNPIHYQGDAIKLY